VEFERANGTVASPDSRRSSAPFLPCTLLTERTKRGGALRTTCFFTTRDDQATCGLQYNPGPRPEIAEGEGVGRISVGFSSPLVTRRSQSILPCPRPGRPDHFTAAPRGRSALALATASPSSLAASNTPHFLDPSVELYDFGTGNLHLYDSSAVDFDSVLFSTTPSSRVSSRNTCAQALAPLRRPSWSPPQSGTGAASSLVCEALLPGRH